MTEDQLNTLKDLHEIQGSDGNWNYDPYMMGMYNGMELMLSIIEGRNPDFKEAPDVWGKDTLHDLKFTTAQDYMEKTK